ncbi:hypothetical protein SKAU_G00036120 [Synaphobranchus kaupii]|uniref:Uncharacterized protein n=1 Tax=Synaphobranchus kaupii TaxID=118154 RepID=A0A9Q1GET1_SYNKA|nr:hypothetical protein SKAU_G00036120 [Synaphobranchus kaupii]
MGPSEEETHSSAVLIMHVEPVSAPASVFWESTVRRQSESFWDSCPVLVRSPQRRTSVVPMLRGIGWGTAGGERGAGPVARLAVCPAWLVPRGVGS